MGLVTAPLFAAIHSPGLVRLLAAVVGDALLLGALLLWLRLYHPGWRPIIGFPRRIGPEVRAGVTFGLVLYPVVVFGIGVVLNLVLQAVSGKSVQAPQQLPSDLGGGRIVLAVLLALVAAPVGEEFFFRGCLFRALRDRYGFAIGAVGSGLAFGLVHWVPGPWQDTILLMSVMVFTGVGLAYVYERRGNIVANMVAHATFNLFGLVLILVLR